MIKKCILAILALFTFFIGTGIDLNAENIGSQPDNKINSSVIKRSNRQQITFKWHQHNLERHYYKHRGEFPEYDTMQKYGNGAVEFFSNPPKGTKFKCRPNGDRLFYYEKNNYFGVTTKEGFVKTFFRPNRGIRYWNRQ